MLPATTRPSSIPANRSEGRRPAGGVSARRSSREFSLDASAAAAIISPVSGCPAGDGSCVRPAMGPGESWAAPWPTTVSDKAPFVDARDPTNAERFWAGGAAHGCGHADGCECAAPVAKKRIGLSRCTGARLWGLNGVRVRRDGEWVRWSDAQGIALGRKTCVRGVDTARGHDRRRTTGFDDRGWHTRFLGRGPCAFERGGVRHGDGDHEVSRIGPSEVRPRAVRSLVGGRRVAPNGVIISAVPARRLPCCPGVAPCVRE